LKSNPSIKLEFRESLLPTSELAAKWAHLLQGIRNKANKEEREREFLFVHGWLRGLADAGLLSDADLPELRELAINAAEKR
jgi:hypothetical protein